SEEGVTPADIEEASKHGREGLLELFRLLGTSTDPALRDAAGRALVSLWAQDQLVTEEEKAIVTRGFEVAWHARRRYPREMKTPIPISANYGVSFRREGVIGGGQLEWSHRITGAERASLETFSPWHAGAGHVRFHIDPRDFPSNGPHRLVLQA